MVPGNEHIVKERYVRRLVYSVGAIPTVNVNGELLTGP